MKPSARQPPEVFTGSLPPWAIMFSKLTTSAMFSGEQKPWSMIAATPRPEKFS